MARMGGTMTDPWTPEAFVRFDPINDPTRNRVELVGYVGNTPELRSSAANTPIVRFSLATRHWHDDGNGPVETTDWHQIVAFAQSAEACRRLRCGELIQLNGRLHTRSWVDRRQVRHLRTEIIVDQIRAPRPSAHQSWLPFERPA